MLPIHLGRTNSTSSSIPATKRAGTEGGPFGTSTCLLPRTRKVSWSLGVREPHTLKVSWSLGVLGCGLLLHIRRNVGFWVEMGLGMDCAELEQAIKKVLRNMLDEKKTLVHCIQGKHRTGGFVMFLYALLDDSEGPEAWIDFYIEKDTLVRPHDRGCVRRVWRESGLYNLLDGAKRDPEIQDLVAQIRARLAEVDESGRQGVEGSCGVKRPADNQGVEGSRHRVQLFPASSSGSQRGAGSSGPQRGQDVLEPAGSASSSGSQRGQDVLGSASPQPSFATYSWMDGDWQCPACGNWNYAYRQQCNFRHCPRAYWKRGDWRCPACGNHNYASRTECAMRNCKAPKP